MKGYWPASLLFRVIDINKHKEQEVLFTKGRQAGIFFINASTKKAVTIFRDCLRFNYLTLTV
jgi:hypothetical protein